MLVAAHAADLTEKARQAGLARAARTSERHPGRLRTSTARLLAGVAHRLDHRLDTIPAHAPISGSR
jgi:hypothetical protein